jgi:uncharacterized protein YndB with AHSA1/START domain
MAAAGELTLTRTFDAPTSVVFQAWTDPARVRQWWGPHDFTTPYCTIDLRPGGLVRYCMKGPDGTEYWGAGVYREIVEPRLIVCTSYFTDRDGSRVSPQEYGMAGWPEETVMTATFLEQEGKTKFTLHETVSIELARKYQALDGWGQSFDRLAAYLPQVAAMDQKRGRGEA